MFEEISPLDLMIVFFPCIRFEAKVPLLFRGENYGQKLWTDLEKLQYSMRMNQEQSHLYQLICKLFYVCKNNGMRMIVENPATQPHYLTTYFPIKPTMIDKDRTQRGDWYKKPTQYWFVNMLPKNNLIFEAFEYVPRYTCDHAEKHETGKGRTINRSMIHPQYANRFIREFILDADGNL